MTSPTRRAFTLLELLVAMAVAAVLSLILVTSLQAAFRAKEATEKSVEAGRSAELVMEALRTDIQSSLPPTRGTFEQAFEGTNNPRGDNSDDLLFFTSSPALAHMVNGVSAANGDVKEIEITAYQPAGSTDHVLVRRTWNNLLDPNLTSTQQQNQNQAPPAQLGDEEVLCRHVVGLTIQYYDGTAQTWDPSWDSTASNPVNVLPTAVQITLQLQSAEKKSDGTPKVVTYTRVFQLPCNGASNDSTTTSTGSASTGGAK